MSDQKVWAANHIPNESEIPKIKKIQLLSGIFLILNIQMSYILLWLSWYTNIKLMVILGLLVLSQYHSNISLF
jgi:hypothetical protein